MARVAKTRSAAASGKQPGGKQTNHILLAGLAIAILVAVLVALGLSSLNKQAQVYVAKDNVAAYKTLNADLLEVKKVPADSVEEDDLTPETYKSLAAKNALVTRVELVKGQRIKQQTLAASSEGSMSAVKNGERVVAVTATFPGTVAGLSVPGSVVDVYGQKRGDEGGQARALISDVKVLGLGVGGAASSDLRPNSQAKQGENNEAAAGLTVLLIVKPDEAGALIDDAGGSVYLSLNPHKRFNRSGDIEGSDGASEPADSELPGSTEDLPSDEAPDGLGDEEIPNR